MAPAGTSPDIVDKIAAEMRRAVVDRSFVERLDSYGADPLGNTPQQFAAMIRSDLAMWAGEVKALGLSHN